MGNWTDIYSSTVADSMEHSASAYLMPTSPLDAYRTNPKTYPTSNSTQMQTDYFYDQRAMKREEIAQASQSQPTEYGGQSREMWNSLRGAVVPNTSQQYRPGTPAPLRARQNAKNGVVSPEIPNLTEERILKDPNNATAILASDATALPSINATALPPVNATALPQESAQPFVWEPTKTNYLNRQTSTDRSYGKRVQKDYVTRPRGSVVGATDQQQPAPTTTQSVQGSPLYKGNAGKQWADLQKAINPSTPQQYPNATPSPLQVRQSGTTKPAKAQTYKDKSLGSGASALMQSYKNRNAELNKIQAKVTNKPSHYSFGGNVGASGTQSYVFGGARFNVVNPLGDLMVSLKEYNGFEQQRKIAHLEGIREEKVAILENIQEAEKNSLEIAKLRLEIDKENNDRVEATRDYNKSVADTAVDQDIARVGLFIDQQNANTRAGAAAVGASVAQQNADTNAKGVEGGLELRGKELEVTINQNKATNTHRASVLQEQQYQNDVDNNFKDKTFEEQKYQSDEQIAHQIKALEEQKHQHDEDIAHKIAALGAAARKNAADVAASNEQKDYDRKQDKIRNDLREKVYASQKKGREDSAKGRKDALALQRERFEHTKKFFDQINPVKLALLNNQLKSSELDAKTQLATIKLAFENVGASRSFDQLLGDDPLKLIDDLDLYTRVEINGEQSPITEEPASSPTAEEGLEAFDWLAD